MFNLDDIIVHKDSGLKASIEYMGVGGYNYCIKSEDGKRYHLDGITAEKSFRLARPDEKLSFRGDKNETV